MQPLFSYKRFFMKEHFWTKFGFFGGHAGLDFANTVDDVDKTRSTEAIPDWATALEWGVAAGVLSSDEAVLLARRTADELAEDELAALHHFREELWGLLSDVAAKRPADEMKTAAVSAEINWALTQAKLEHDDASFRWSVTAEAFGLKLLRARVALAVGDLLSRQDLHRLRECGRCTGLFLDHGRGRGRRWCRMNTCGNRTKTERFRGKADSG